MIRSILAVLGSVVAWGVLWVATNATLAGAFPARFDASGITTDPAMLLAFLAACALLCIGAGWLCAVVAPRAVMKHVAVLAVIQLTIGIAVQAGVWDQMPVWYHLTFLGLVVPMHLVGGRLRVVRAERRGGATLSPA